MSGLQQFVSGPLHKWGRRFKSDRLARPQQLRQCPIQTSKRSNKHYSSTKSSGNHNCSLVACSNLVSKTDTDCNMQSNKVTQSKNYLLPPSNTHSRARKNSEMENVCLEGEWQSRLKLRNWSPDCTVVYKHCIADSSLRQYNRYILQFKSFCINKAGTFPPTLHDTSSLIASFMKSKSDQSDRPESMLKSIQAALTHYFMATSDSNPFDNDLRNFMTALKKHYTRHAAGRTMIMPIKPISDLFSSWPDNEQLTIKQLRQKTISLLSLGMMARPSDLAPSMGFSRNQIKFNNDRSMTLTLCGIKNDSDRHGFEIKIDSASNPKVDPVSAL